ncbi:MAG: uroporphyrinogen decarboxylase [Chloroflexi bacterium]|nr:uroporphyrinogen decarboxylase [Chloroflexota bacterium]
MTARFLSACRREPVDCTPVWFMRQAGRYLPEYRAIRKNLSLLEICARPDVAAEVTLQPVDILGVDAAILFADILLPLVPMGIQLEFAAGEGPVIHNPVRTAADVANLRAVDAATDLDNVMQTIRRLRRALESRDVPLIGFAGAPFTLASYLIEGGATRTFRRTKQLMYGDPTTWHALMDRLATVVADYLNAQVAAGAQAVQLFDSWVGQLSPDDYAAYVLPYSQRILRAVSGVPTIHFGTDTATLLPHMREAGSDVVGLDWRVPLDQGWQTVGDVAVQGNLDPLAPFAPRDVLEAKVRDVLRRAGGRPGHIFNLGHGLLPETPVDNVRAVVDMVHEWTN